MNLKGAILQKPRLEGVNFSGSDLSSARLDGADLTQVGFEGSKPDYTTFKYARITREEQQRLFDALLAEGRP